MCVRMHRDANKNAIPNTFKESKEYCEGIESGASLLYFTTPNDAVKVWEWLGKHYSLWLLNYYVFNLYNIQYISKIFK